MTINDLFLLLTLIALLGVAIFFISALLNLIKKQSAKEEWIRTLIFFILSLLFFVLFGLTLP